MRPGGAEIKDWQLKPVNEDYFDVTDPWLDRHLEQDTRCCQEPLARGGGGGGGGGEREREREREERGERDERKSERKTERRGFARTFYVLLINPKKSASVRGTCFDFNKFLRACKEFVFKDRISIQPCSEDPWQTPLAWAMKVP